MEYLLLGPLAARVDDQAVDLGAGKQRALLALLLLDARRTVSTERLIDDLWGGDAPETARKMVQIHVSKLRRLLPPGALRTRAAGYELEVAPGATDLGRFERLAAEGRGALAAGRPGDAAAALGAALALWRGAALEEFGEPFALRERARLESLRLAALEDRIEADLARGADGELTAELDALVLAHPERERLRGQQMLALYRSGRQSEALASYQAAWHHFDALGIQPSSELRALEQRILVQDLALSGAGPAAAPQSDRSVRYAVNGDVSLAYQVFGDGPAELVLVTGWVLPMELFWDDVRFAAFLDRLGTVARVLVWDKRGTGLSDRVSPLAPPTTAERVDDLRAVIDAAGFERPVVFGLSEGVHLAVMLAAAHPERVRALGLYGGWARTLAAPDHPAGDDPDDYARLIETVRKHWGDAAHLLRYWAPSSQHDVSLRVWWARALRLGATPTAAVLWLQMLADVDLRDVLPALRVPTVVMHRRGDVIVRVGNGRHLGAAIPGARYIELDGEDHLWWLGDRDSILDPVIDLLAGGDGGAPPVRVLATVLAVHTTAGPTDPLPDAEVRRHGGRVLGAGLAAFEGPSNALSCAAALRAADGAIAAGVQIGECERDGDRLTGPAVDEALRLSAIAAPGVILVPRTVAGLVAAEGLAFEPAAERELGGPAGAIAVAALARAD